MTVSERDKRGLVEELRSLRTRLDAVEQQNTRLTQAERELRENLEMFKTVLDNSPLGLYRTTPDGRILMANSALTDMLGFRSFDELARQNLEHEGYEPMCPRSDFKERIEREGKVVGLESAWRKSDGTTLHVRESAQAVRDESGSVLYYQGTVEDITEHKQTTRALHESEELFAALVKNLGEGVDIVDENLRCLFANPAGEEIFGVPPGGLVGRTLYEFVSDEDRRIVDAQRNNRREGIANSYDLEIIRPDGQKRQLIVTGTPRFSPEGEYVGAIAVFFDVTEKKQAQEVLRTAHDQMEAKVQERTAELQRANEALRERELSLDLALQVAQLGRWDWDIPSGKIVCSDEIYRMFGRRPGQFQFTYEGFLDFVHPADRDSVGARVQAAIVESRPFDMDFRIVIPGGRQRVLHCRAEVLKSLTGEPLRMIGTTKDITERREAERQVRERARIIDSTTDSVIKTDANGIVTLWNRGAERIFGYTSQEMMGRPITTLYSEREQGRLAEITQTLLRGEDIATTEVTCLHKNGSPVELAVSLLPLKDDSGDITEFVGISKDITERKKAREALRDSENRYRTAIENAGEGIVVVQDGVLRFVNSRHTEVTGFSPEESMARPFMEFVHPDDRKTVAKVHAARLKGEHVPAVYEFRIIDKDGSIRWLENNGVMIEWNGRPASLNFLRNVTERKKAEEELRRERDKAQNYLDVARVVIVALNVEGTVTLINKKGCELLGYPEREIIGKNWFDSFLPERLKGQVKQVFGKLAAGEWEPVEYFENPIVTRSGEERLMAWHNTTVSDDAGNIVGCLSSAEDITEHRNAQEELQKRAHLQQILLDSMPCVALLLRPGTREIVACNKAGADAGAVPGTRCYQAWAKKGSPCPWCRAPELWATGQAQHCEPAGDGKVWDAHWVPVSDDLYMHYAFDITERKQAEETLRETTGLLETVFAHTHILVAYLDSQFNFVRVNRAYAHIDGRDPSFYVGRNHFELYPNAENQAIFRKVLEIGVPYFAHARAFRYAEHPERGTTYWDWSLVPIKQRDGAVSGLVLTLVNVTEQKEAEQALRESEERFRKVFEEGPLGMVLTSLDMKFFDANPAFCRMLGYTVEEMSGKTFLDVTHPAHRDADRENVEKMWRGEIPQYTTEKRYVTKNGDIRWGRVSTSLIRDQGGEPLYAIATVEDITERKCAEEELREREATLNSIFRAAPVGIGLERGPLLSRVNDTICQMLGYSEDELLGRHARMFYPNEDDYESIKNETRRQIAEKGKGTIETRWKHKDGRIIDVLLSTTVLDPADFDKGVTFTALDITERKAAEEALRESEARYRVIFQTAMDGFWRVDMQGRLVEVNETYCRMSGYSREELLGMSISDLEAVENPAEAAAHIRKIIAKGQDRFESKHRRKDGTLFEVEVCTQYRPGEGGWFIGFSRDITERKRAEKELREREATLNSIFRAAPVGIGLTRDRALARVNDTICRMLGYSREELLGQHPRMFYAGKEDYLFVSSEKRRQITQTGTATVETRWKHKDGRIIDVLLSMAALDPTDTSKGLTFTALDITERKAAEESLRESELKFRSLAEQSPNMIFINKGGRVVYANKKCEQILGYTREQLYSPDFDFRVLIAPESMGVINESFARHSRGREVESYDYRLVTRAGERIDAINVSKLIQYEGDTAVLGIVTDITERKKAEQTLRESQERLKILFESAPDAIYVTDLEGRFVDGNKAAEELVGFSKAELIGKSLEESGLLSADDLRKAAANVQRVASGRPSGPTEYAVRKKSGSVIAVEVRTFPVTIAGRTLSLGIARDVTARKHAEEAIRASEQKFRTIFETAANMITSVNEQGVIVDCNDRVREVLGYEKEDILGRSMARIIHPDCIARAQNALQEILSKGFSYNKEYKMVRNDGSLIDVNINSSGIEDEQGKYVRTLCIIDDITERKKTQQRLLDDREQLKSLASRLSLTEERERHRLATLLHDHIGQSLVISKIKLDQLRKSADAAGLASAIGDISHSIGQMIQEVRTLTFDLSYPILYELGFEAAVAEWLTEQIEEKYDVKTEFQDDGQDKPLDEDIRALLFRNVRELLINIVKHAQAQHVKVSVARADKNICVGVEDDGVGFDPADVAAAAARRAEFGLFSIRERLEQLGGYLEIDSKPGQGAKITMVAPLKCEQETDGAQK